MGNSADIEGGNDELLRTLQAGKSKGKGEPSQRAAPRGLPKGKGKGPARRQWTVECIEKPREGTAVEVMSGPHEGRRGVVVKVVGEGETTRYRVSFGDGGAITWVDQVQRVVVREKGEGEACDDADPGPPPLANGVECKGASDTHAASTAKRVSGMTPDTQASTAKRVSGMTPATSEGTTAKRVSSMTSVTSVESTARRVSVVRELHTQSTGAFSPSSPKVGLPKHISFESELQARLKSSSSLSSPNTRPSLRKQTSNSSQMSLRSIDTADYKYCESTGSRHGIPTPKKRPDRFKRLVTAEIKAKEAARSEKIERERRELQARKEHYKALRPADVKCVPWEQAKELNWVHGGSGGILLVDLGDQAVVLKPQGKTAVSEQLAQLLAPVCGVRVAQCRIVRHGESEHDSILNIHVVKDVPVVGGDKLKASNIFGKHLEEGKAVGEGCQFFGVLEYVPGHPLVGEEAHQVLLTPDPVLLRDLGRLCAMDALLNNMDRVPLPIWSNEGNLGNVMVSAYGGGIVGIDQQVNPIKAGPGFDMYMDKIEKLYESILPNGDPDPVLCTLRKALETNCGATLPDEHAAHVFQGMRECLEAIARAWVDGSFTTLLEEAGATCHDRFYDPDCKAHDKVWDEDEMNRMKCFLVRVAEKIAGIVQGAGGADD